jgi:cystathionine beta-synthase
MEVYGNPEHFAAPVAEAMEGNLVTVAPHDPVEKLKDIFERGMVAIVVDGEEFLGLITRIDLLNWLRRRSG